MCRCVAFAAMVVLAAHGMAADKSGFLDRTLKGPDGVEAKYVVFVPHKLEAGKKPPVILFLHGAFRFGTDGKRHSTWALGTAIRAREKDFPFVVVMPQAQKLEKDAIETWYPGHPEGDRALAMLDAAMKEFNGDPQRISLTGYSMGGFGTWKMADAFPKKWAAIVPICGGGETAWAANIKDIPCWCFHGDKDSMLPVARSRSMIEALKAAGAKPKYDEYPGVDHNCWDKAYGTDALYTWLLEQKLK